MILIEWVDKQGNPRRICIGGKRCGELEPLGTNSSDSNEDIVLSVGGKKFSNDAAILLDKNLRYGLISKSASELAFKNSKDETRLIDLKDLVIDFKNTRERLSVRSLITIIESNDKNHYHIKEKSNCIC